MNLLYFHERFCSGSVRKRYLSRQYLNSLSITLEKDALIVEGMRFLSYFCSYTIPLQGIHIKKRKLFGLWFEHYKVNWVFQGKEQEIHFSVRDTDKFEHALSLLGVSLIDFS